MKRGNKQGQVKLVEVSWTDVDSQKQSLLVEPSNVKKIKLLYDYDNRS